MGMHICQKMAKENEYPLWMPLISKQLDGYMIWYCFENLFKKNWQPYHNPCPNAALPSLKNFVDSWYHHLTVVIVSSGKRKTSPYRSFFIVSILRFLMQHSYKLWRVRCHKWNRVVETKGTEGLRPPIFKDYSSRPLFSPPTYLGGL